MEEFDRQVKECLQDELAEITLSAQSKDSMMKAMVLQLSAERSTGWQLLSGRIREFLESTYEVSLAPVAAFLSLLVIVGGVTVYSTQVQPQPIEKPTMVYMRQVGDSVEIMYLPAEVEER